MNFKIRDFKEEVTILLLLTFLQLFVPGILGIFYFDRLLFESLDFAKLILLATSFATPFVGINFLLVIAASAVVKPPSSNEEEVSFMALVTSSLLSSLIFYPILFIAFMLNLNAKDTLVITVCVEILIAAAIIFGLVRVSRRLPRGRSS